VSIYVQLTWLGLKLFLWNGCNTETAWGAASLGITHFTFRITQFGECSPKLEYLPKPSVKGSVQPCILGLSASRGPAAHTLPFNNISNASSSLESTTIPIPIKLNWKPYTKTTQAEIEERKFNNIGVLI
jgi:hypothetical protein